MPNFYNPYQMYPNYYQPQQQPQQTQTNGFIPISSELEARNYPVAPGNSVTFKDENAPYIYTKTMGFSQLDQPIFDKYKLIKEEQEVPVAKERMDELKKLKEEIKMTDDDIEELRNELQSIWGEINVLKQPKRLNKREKDGDD
jgi:hypothetical protein